MRRLHDYLRREHKGKPEYSEGWLYDRHGWTIIVKGEYPPDELFFVKWPWIVDGTTCGEGKGTDKRKARDAAAARALESFGQECVEIID